MKRMLITLMVVLGMVSISRAQQSLPDSVVILGEWHLSDVQEEVYAQKDNRLLEKRLLDRAEFSLVKAYIPYMARFTSDSCLFSGRTNMAGGYSIIRGRMIKVQQNVVPGQPQTVNIYGYIATARGVELTMPASYYRDEKWAEVKVIYRCQYVRN